MGRQNAETGRVGRAGKVRRKENGRLKNARTVNGGERGVGKTRRKERRF